jgi:hypothetical protein
LSTKIPEYFSTGKPVIAIGPNNCGTIKYLESIDRRMTINRVEDFNKILDMSDDELTEITEKCLNAAKENHLTNIVQKTVKNALQHAISYSKK